MREGPSDSARLAAVLGAAALVFALWLAVGPDGNPGIGFFFAAPIGMATWWWGARAGVAAVVGCCALYFLGSRLEPVPDLGAALVIRAVAFSLVATVISLLRQRLIVLEHSAEELEAIRAALTPSSLPELTDVEAAAAFVPSEHGVSGDFYLLTNGADGSTVAIVGDVVGHGPEAARLATFVRARFAAFAASTSDPGELLTLANTALLERTGRKQELVSAVCLRFGPGGGLLQWSIAGHPPPLWLPDLEELRSAEETFLLGARADLELASIEASLDTAGGAVLFTDGATDVRRDGELLGVEGLAKLLAPLRDGSAAEIVREAERRILAWTDQPVRDDLCILALKPRPTPP